jgi:hypothetical protein
MREKGTLNNFMSDGVISADSIKWLLRSGKVPIGKERTQLIDREQLSRWGVLIVSKTSGTGTGTQPAAKPKIIKKKKEKERVVLPVVQEVAAVATTEEGAPNV